MPPAKKRQRTAAATRPPGRVARGIYEVGRIVKVESAPLSGAKKRKIEVTDDIDGCSVKLVKIEDRVSAECLSTSINGSPDDFGVQAPPRSSAGPDTAKQDTKGSKKSAVHSHRLLKEGRASIKSLLVASTLSAKSSTLDQLPSNACASPPRLLTSQSWPDTVGPTSEALPKALQDLIKLHSSFLTALALHHAHNGSIIPADLRLLIPSIERAWGKRTVTTDDIRRTIGILEGSQCGGDAWDLKEHMIKLSDYGNGKICAELSDGLASLSAGCLLDTDGLNAKFSQNLYGFWKDWTSSNTECTDKKSEPSIDLSAKDLGDTVAIRKTCSESEADFIQQLPKSIVHTCSSLEKIAPLLAKGQMRYKEFKEVAAMHRNNSESRGKSQPLGREGVEDRGKSLLERIRAKALHQSTLPPPPSKDMLQRTSALQRLDEVISVLVHLSTSGSGLSGIKRHSDLTVEKASAEESSPFSLQHFRGTVGQQRVSFPLSTLVAHLKNSLPNPISKDEAEQCIRLLVEEVAPHWVNMVTSGKVVAVIVNKGASTGITGWKDRIKM